LLKITGSWIGQCSCVRIDECIMWSGRGIAPHQDDRAAAAMDGCLWLIAF